MHSTSGRPASLLDAAQRCVFEAVICVSVLHELVRNLARKAPSALYRLELLLEVDTFEVVQDPPAAAVEPWLQAGIGTDSVVIAAAHSAEVAYFCTGDTRLVRKLGASDLPFELVTPAQMLAHLQP